MTEYPAIVGGIVAIIGAGGLAIDNWRDRSRTNRNDHQACLQLLAEQDAECRRRLDLQDAKIDTLREEAVTRGESRSVEIAELRDRNASLKEHVQTLTQEVKSIRKSISPQPMPKVKP